LEFSAASLTIRTGRPVTGVFPSGKGGPVVLILSVDATKYSEEEITKMLESIQ
jgi:hypothetical protein